MLSTKLPRVQAHRRLLARARGSEMGGSFFTRDHAIAVHIDRREDLVARTRVNEGELRCT